MKYIKQILHFIIFILSFNIQSCFVLKEMTGTNIDEIQFSKARQAKIHEIQLNSLEKLAARLQKSNQMATEDISFTVSRDFLSKIIKQYIGTSGWLDKDTRFTIEKTELTLQNGSGIASFSIQAFNSFYKVEVDLVMDCLMNFRIDTTDIFIEIEPFNIIPVVKTGLILSGTEEIISNLIKINLHNIGRNLPNLKLPVEMKDTILVKSANMVVADKINMIINSPERNISYNFKIKEILILEEGVYFSLSVDKVGVR